MPSRTERPLRGLVVLALCAYPVAMSAGGQSELVIHKDGTKLYHRASCPEVAGAKSGILAMTRAQAEARGYTPHEACDPATASTPQGPASSKAEAPPTVYLDGTRYYHTSTCKTLPKDKKTIKTASLEVAGKSHWPCPACKPPVRKRADGPAVPGVPGAGGRGR